MVIEALTIKPMTKHDWSKVNRIIEKETGLPTPTIEQIKDKIANFLEQEKQANIKRAKELVERYRRNDCGT